LHLLLPLVSAVVYVIGALLLKRASDLGADIWRTTRVINYTSLLVAAPLWWLGGTIPPPSSWWQPPVAAVLFFAGQIFTLLAINKGDVSVATPVLGVKILLVALLTSVLIGDPIGAQLWTAAALCSAPHALGKQHPRPSPKQLRPPKSCSPRLARRPMRVSMSWCRNGLAPGERAVSCRSRWRAGLCIPSR
jgi:drug/metabolite transporter (DMT)-like permease